MIHTVNIKMSAKLLAMEFISVEATGEECAACDDKIYMNQFRAIPKVEITLHFQNGDSDSFVENVNTDYAFCQACADSLKGERQ